MVKKVMALCDKEEKYLYHMADFLEKKNVLPFTVHAFTDVRKLKSFMDRHEVELLLIAENAYEEEVIKYPVPHIFILNESGSEIGREIENINKYQSSESILNYIIKSYTSDSEELPRRLAIGNRMKIIGNYTPVGRCLQTTFALSMGQLLAKKHKTLYLNFESYSGFNSLFDRDFPADITDVMYFLNCEREKISYRLDSMVETVNGLDYIPPVLSYRQLNEIKGQQWIELFREIERTSDYEYLILDLSDQIDGLFDILRECAKIFTIIRKDGFAEAKLRQYEAVMQSMNYDDIAVKTKKWSLPVFQKIPYGLDQLTHGELASYVKTLINEEIYVPLGQDGMG